jgi:hypothetical protein
MWKRIAQISVAVAVLGFAIGIAFWSSTQTYATPGLQVWFYLALPSAAACLVALQKRHISTVAVVYGEVLLVPALIAGQLGRIGLVDEFVPLMISLQVGAVLIGQWARWRRAV